MSSEPVVNGIKQYFGQVETKLTAPLFCHVMHIFNVSESIEKALEEWRYYQNPNKAPFERMEHVNRPIIYSLDVDAPEVEQTSHVSKATYKLLLRDAFGNFFFAIELEELPFLRTSARKPKNPLPVHLGGHLRLKEGTVVAEGIVLLKRNQCIYVDPEPSSQMARSLNNGIVAKTIAFLERLLKTAE